MLTRSAWGAATFSITRLTCSRKRRQGVEFLHRLDQLLQVLESSGRVRGALGLPHRGVAGFVEHGLGEFARRPLLQLATPAVERREQLQQRVAGPRRQLVGLAHRPRRLAQADLGTASGRAQAAQRAVADATPRQIDDALQRQIVVRLADDPEIRDRVADLGPLIEARSADDTIGNAQLDEALLERAGLEARADQHGRLVEAAALPLPGLDLVGDEAGLLLVVPEPRDPDLLALLVLGPQGLAVAGAIAGDDAGSSPQDVPGGAVVALQADHLSTREILLEAQNVADLGAAPAVDRLVVVADAGDVAVTAGEQPQPEILGHIGVLVLVDQDGPEAALILGQDVGMAGQQGQAMQQQVAEIAGVQGRQPLLIGCVEFHALAQREVARLGGRHLVGPVAAVLPALDGTDQQARRPAPLVEFGRLDDLLGQTLLVVAVQDGEAGLQADQLRVRADHAHAHRVEGTQPHARDAAADQPLDPLGHLARGAVGEGHGQHLVRAGTAGDQDVGEPGGEHARLAGSRSGQDQERAVGSSDRSKLLGVQALKIRSAEPGRRHGGRRTRHNTHMTHFAPGCAARNLGSIPCGGKPCRRDTAILLRPSLR